MEQITTVGIDLAKNVFSLHGVDGAGKTVLRRTVRRDRLMETVASLSPCLISAARTHGEADGAQVRGALSQERQERRERRRGRVRSGEPAEHALCTGEVG